MLRPLPFYSTYRNAKSWRMLSFLMDKSILKRGNYLRRTLAVSKYSFWKSIVRRERARFLEPVNSFIDILYCEIASWSLRLVTSVKRHGLSLLQDWIMCTKHKLQFIETVNFKPCFEHQRYQESKANISILCPVTFWIIFSLAKVCTMKFNIWLFAS